MFLIFNSGRDLGTIEFDSEFGVNTINIFGAIMLKILGYHGFLYSNGLICAFEFQYLADTLALSDYNPICECEQLYLTNI